MGGTSNYKIILLKRFLSFEMDANWWYEQFNTNLVKIQYCLDFILIFFINRDKEEKTKNRYLTAAKLDPIQKNQCHIRNRWPRFTQNQVSNLLHSWKVKLCRLVFSLFRWYPWKFWLYNKLVNRINCSASLCGSWYCNTNVIKITVREL